MAKKNDTKSKKVVEQPDQVVGEPVGNELDNTPAITPDTSTTEQIQPESGEKELQVLQSENSGETADGTENTELDTAGEIEAAGEKGDEAGDKVEDIEQSGNEQHEKIAAGVFENNPRAKELFFTADLIPFFYRSDAVRHAGTLKDDTIVTINRK